MTVLYAAKKATVGIALATTSAASDGVCAFSPSAGISSCHQSPRTRRALSWLEGSEVSASASTTSSRGRRLELAWLSLELQARALGREVPTKQLYESLTSLDEDSAVALLRLVTSEPAPVNYTIRVLQLAEARGLRVSLASAVEHRRVRRRRTSGSKSDSNLGKKLPWAQRLSATTSSTGHMNFVAIRPRNGIGNRLLAVASAAALALALNRSLFVLWEDPNFRNVLETVGGMCGSSVDEDNALQMAAAARGVKMISLVAGWPHFRDSAELLACGHPSLSSPGVLLVETDQFFLPLLQLGGSAKGYRETLHSALTAANSTSSEFIGAAPSAVDDLTAWSRELLLGLFRLGPNIREKVRSEIKKLFGGASFVLGVHIRTRMYDYEKGLVPEIDIDDAFACIDAALAANQPSNTLSSIRTPDTSETVIFIATPSESVKRKARKRFGARVRTRRGVVTDRSKSAAELDAVIDLALLAMSDHLITSVHSTFGYVAQSLTGVRPYVLTENDPSNISSGVVSSKQAMSFVGKRCMQASYTAPCFHAGFALASNAAGIVNGGGAETRRCWAEAAKKLLSDMGEVGAPWAPCRF